VEKNHHKNPQKKGVVRPGKKKAQKEHDSELETGANREELRDRQMEDHRVQQKKRVKDVKIRKNNYMINGGEKKKADGCDRRV